MDFSTADQYYLKARDYYPFNLEFAIENLNYSLSYDDKHAAANCMMGKIYMYYLKDYDSASKSFYNALEGDMNYPDTYKYYSLLRIWEGQYDRALKIIERGMKVRGMDKSILLMHTAIIHEWKMEFKAAKKVLKHAKLITINEYRQDQIDKDLSRISKKLRIMKVEKKRKKGAGRRL